jgi:L-lactate dehydrogenase (cytochrome)
MAKAASTTDYRDLARRRLPHFLFEYIDGGAYGETTLARNVSDLQAIALRQRVLRDVSTLNLKTSLFGTEYALPVALAPIGLAGLTARRGEAQAVRAAEKANIPLCLSTVSACPIAEVAAAATRPFWFQMYMVRDRGFMRDLLAQARTASCSALVFTVDLPVPGARYRDVRSGLAGAPGLGGLARRAGQALRRPRWLWDVAVRGRPLSLGNVAPMLKQDSGLKDFLAWISTNFDASLTWSDLDWIREQWDGPIILKGVLDVEDAVQAANLGLDGIVVSNHGGRQLDGVLSSTRALPAIAQAVGERLTVMADGGVRSGLDVMRMLALGARGVMIGRPWVFGLAAAGEQGVSHVLSLIEAEMKVAMALTGCTRISDIGPHILSDYPG